MRKTFIVVKVIFGIEELLLDLEAKGFKWGIVTNKIKKFTMPVLKEEIKYFKKSILCCLWRLHTKSKTASAPLQLACKELNVNTKKLYLCW